MDDELGPTSNDQQFAAKWEQLGDMSALNTMPPAHIVVSGTYEDVNGETRAHIKLTNTSNHVAFFLRAEITKEPDGPEVLPIRYVDNYVTVFPHDTCALDAVFDSSLLAGQKPSLRLEGYKLSR